MEGVVVDVAGVVVSGLVPGEIQHVLVALKKKYRFYHILN